MKQWLILGIVAVLAACTNVQLPEECDPYLGADACTMQYDPVCVTFENGTEKTIGNECTACTSGEDITSIRPGECEAPGQEEPRQDVSLFTECTEPRPEVCTREYNPVCAFANGSYQTKGNACDTCSDPEVQRFAEGACEEQLFVICEETVTGFSAEEYARDQGGICVDSCPEGFDPYTTQIGVRVCILHYGVEEMDGWPVCQRSTETCNCVRTTETTTGEQIEDAEYRCVPDQYAERLLFTSGQDRLDERGEQSVAIA